MSDLKSLIQNIDKQLVEVTDKAARARQLAAASREEMNRYILVEIGSLKLAVNIDHLSEVGPLPPVTALPNLPVWIQGIINIRSDIVSLIDLAAYLGIDGAAACDGTRLAVLRHHQMKVGLRLDRIIGTVHRPVSDRQPLEAAHGNSSESELFSWGLPIDNNLYSLLDVPRFLTVPRLVDYNARG